MRHARFALLVTLAALMLQVSARAAPADEFAAARVNMVRIIEVQIQLTSSITGIRSLAPRVVSALSKVPRHAFLPQSLVPFAYTDRPLPLGFGQNISQPFIIGLMTELLEIQPGDVVFETGTGAGYHAAVLAELTDQVFSIEVVDELAAEAGVKLGNLGYKNVRTRAGDGYFGWAENGPYDAILLKEAVDHVPPPLLNQLKPGGRMVLPLGPLNGPQFLTVVRKQPDGATTETRILEVQFAPLQGGDRI